MKLDGSLGMLTGLEIQLESSDGARIEIDSIETN
jgi:hypothetical protein